MEARPTDQNGTDFYLQYGDGEGTTFNSETIPGNVWFQFWVYLNHSSTELSQLDSRNKFIYACNGTYPCSTHKWMVSIGSHSHDPFWTNLGSPSNGDAFLQTPVNFEVAEVINTNVADWDKHKLGQTNIGEYMAANRWTLVKIHADTSTQSGRIEAWMRSVGGSWVKVTEWIDGVTPGFTWRINPAHVGGHRVIRIPPVFGPSHLDYPVSTWMYMDDFAIARSESGLPQYSQ